MKTKSKFIGSQREYEMRFYDALDTRNSEYAKFMWEILTEDFNVKGNKIVLLKGVDNKQYSVDPQTGSYIGLKKAAHEECFEDSQNMYLFSDIGILAIYADTVDLECAICGNRLYRPEKLFL